MGITFSKRIQERNEDNKEAFIFIHDTEEEEYQYRCEYLWTMRTKRVVVGISLNLSYKEIRTYRNKFVKNELSINIGSLSKNNPITKKIAKHIFIRQGVRFIYEDGEWKFQENTFYSVENFVKDILWHSLQYLREFFKQLHQEIEKHPNKEHFQSVPKSILGFPAIREAMQKLLDSEVEIEGDASDVQISGEDLIHLYRQKMSVDEMEEQLLMEDPRQKRFEEQKRVVSQMVEEARNHPQKIAHGEVCDMHMDLQISDNF